jgi:hypothetical protein
MKPYLSKAAVQLREQIDDCFPDRSRKSDGWIASAQHQMRSKVSDHNPLKSGEVCAIDITADLGAAEGISAYLADQIRIAGKTDKRIKYVIHNHHIASKLLNWRWRRYKGASPHTRPYSCFILSKSKRRFF